MLSPQSDLRLLLEKQGKDMAIMRTEFVKLFWVRSPVTRRITSALLRMQSLGKASTEIRQEGRNMLFVDVEEVENLDKDSP